MAIDASDARAAKTRICPTRFKKIGITTDPVKYPGQWKGQVGERQRRWQRIIGAEDPSPADANAGRICSPYHKDIWGAPIPSGTRQAGENFQDYRINLND